MQTLNKQQVGISIIVVLFILAGLSALVLSLVNLSGSQHLNSTFSAQAAQTYLVSRSAINYGLSRIAAGADCSGIQSALTIDNHAVTMGCAAVGSYNEGDLTNTYTIYSITATVSRGNFQLPSVSNRQMRATIKYP